MRLSLIILGYLYLVPSLVLAQSVPADDLQNIKSNITRQILDRNRLVDENDELRRQYEVIKARYDQRMDETQKLNRAEQAKIATLQNQLDSGAYSRQSLDELEADLTIRKTQTAQLRSRLMDLEYQEHLWKIKAADTEYRRQALEMELSLKQTAYDEQAGAYVSKVEQLSRAIQRNRLEERELMTQYMHLEDEAEILNRQHQIFEKENAYLQKERSSYKDLQGKTQAQAEQARQRSSSEQKSFEQALKEKQVEKGELQVKIESLREEKSKLDQQLTNSLQQLEGQAQLVADIKSLKEDNERLKAALAELQSKAAPAVP